MLLKELTSQMRNELDEDLKSLYNKTLQKIGIRKKPEEMVPVQPFVSQKKSEPSKYSSMGVIPPEDIGDSPEPTAQGVSHAMRMAAFGNKAITPSEPSNDDDEISPAMKALQQKALAGKQKNPSTFVPSIGLSRPKFTQENDDDKYRSALPGMGGFKMDDEDLYPEYTNYIKTIRNKPVKPLPKKPSETPIKK